MQRFKCSATHAVGGDRLGWHQLEAFHHGRELKTLSSWWGGAQLFTITSLVVSRVASTWQTLKKLLLNQTKPTGLRLSSEKQAQGAWVTRGHSVLMVEWRERVGLWLVLRGKGAQTSAEVIFFPFFLGGMSQPGFCYYGEGENGCQGEPQIYAALGQRTAWGRAWGVRSGLHATEMGRLGGWAPCDGEAGKVGARGVVRL